VTAVTELHEAEERPARAAANLTGALARAREELHLLYELGATLAAELPLESEAAIILERILAIIPASRAELRVTGSDLPIFVRHGKLDGFERKLGHRAEHRLRTILRSGGEEVGSLDLVRPIELRPFTGSDHKLVDAVGALIATAIRNAKLHLELRLRAEDFEPEARCDTGAERLLLAGDLRRALERRELRVAYQPQIDPRSGNVTGVEALCRWDHPSRGAIAPGQFIPLAETSGLIQPLTYWLAGQVCRDKRHWQDLGLDRTVAINLSMLALANPDLAEDLANIVRRNRVEPDGIMFEMSESTVMADPARQLDLYHLRAMGFRLAVDDFGTGYASLSYLRRLPVEEIKIDRLLVQAMLGDSDAIVQSIVDLGHSLGLTVVAKGVEDASTLQRLTALGCDAVQGFYTGRPVASHELLRLASAQRLAAASA